MPRIFKTDDGYTLTFDAETRQWTDGDLSFDADSENNDLPIDCFGELLDGKEATQ